VALRIDLLPETTRSSWVIVTTREYGGIRLVLPSTAHASVKTRTTALISIRDVVKKGDTRLHTSADGEKDMEVHLDTHISLMHTLMSTGLVTDEAGIADKSDKKVLTAREHYPLERTTVTPRLPREDLETSQITPNRVRKVILQNKAKASHLGSTGQGLTTGTPSMAS
jgi:hypothetical protein